MAVPASAARFLQDSTADQLDKLVGLYYLRSSLLCGAQREWYRRHKEISMASRCAVQQFGSHGLFSCRFSRAWDEAEEYGKLGHESGQFAVCHAVPCAKGVTAQCPALCRQDSRRGEKAEPALKHEIQ